MTKLTERELKQANIIRQMQTVLIEARHAWHNQDGWPYAKINKVIREASRHLTGRGKNSILAEVK